MKILLVDDERPVIEALLTAINWEELGFDQTAAAYDADEAQNILEQGGVGVMLCDIEMPGSSGLELLQWTRAHRPDTVSILFTCHADFRYAQRAVALGAFDYLLKPVAMDAVRETVSRAAAEWDRRQARGRREGQWERNKDAVEERFWLETVLGELPEKEGKLRAAAVRRGVELNPQGSYLLIVCTIRTLGSGLTDWQAVDLDFALKNILSELFTFRGPPVVVSDSPRRKIVILPWNEDLEQGKLEGRCNDFFAAMRRYFETEACFYVGKPAPLAALAGQQRLLRELEQQNISYNGRIFYDHQAPGNDVQADEPAWDRWKNLLEQRSKGELCGEVGSWLRCQVEKGSMNARNLELFYHDFLQMLYSVLAQNNISAAQLFRDQAEQTEKAQASVEAMESYLSQLVCRSCAYLEQAAGGNPLVEQVKEYIDAHLTEDLSRDLLAGIVYLNPNYLSRLFRQETGKSLVDYITHRRIQRVKLLLRTTNLSVTEAAGQMGYTNMPYFSKVFKKEVGCSPVEYRAGSHRK